MSRSNRQALTSAKRGLPKSKKGDCPQPDGETVTVDAAINPSHEMKSTGRTRSGAQPCHVRQQLYVLPRRQAAKYSICSLAIRHRNSTVGVFRTSKYTHLRTFETETLNYLKKRYITATPLYQRHQESDTNTISTNLQTPQTLPWS